MHAEAVPQPLVGTTCIYSRSYNGIRSAQTPRPTEGQGHHPGNGHHRHQARDPLKHPESKVQRGQAGKREATRRWEREQHTHKQPS